MRWVNRVKWSLVVLGLGLAACDNRDVVAKVGGISLTRADLSLYMDSRAEAQKPVQALDGLIDRTLLVEGAEKAGLLENPEVRARAEAARREVLANAYLDKATEGAAAEPVLRQRYEAKREKLARRQIHVAHIIVRLPSSTDSRARTEAQARINTLYARIQGGEDFAAVAREASDDSATGQQGGDLGPVEEGQVDPRFFAAVKDLKKGELSRPFDTAYGLHVARALEEPRTVVPSFEEIRGRLAAEARQEAAEALMKQLRDDITVKRYPERLTEQQKFDGGESR